MDKGGILPQHPLAKLGAFGSPYHGLVTGGSLTLPTGAAITYPQPFGAWPDLAGATHMVRHPSAPTLSSTPLQDAIYASHGHQWRDVAMLSGSRMQLYGVPLDGWIYIDSAGDRWLVKTGTLTTAYQTWATGLLFSVTLERFGDLGRPAEIYTYSVSLSDVGQATPDATFGGVSQTQGWVSLWAVQPQGQAAAFMLHPTPRTAMSAGSSVIDNHVHYALGWLELSITGLGGAASVSLSVLRTRAQTIIATGDPWDIDGLTDGAEYGVIEVYWNGGASSMAYIENPGDPYPPPGVTEPYYGFSVHPQTHNRSASGSRSSIVSIMAKPGGGWSECTLSMDRSRWLEMNPPVMLSTFPTVAERSRAATASVSVSLAVDGVEVWSESGSASMSATEQWGLSPAFNTVTATWSGSFGGVAFSGSETIDPVPPTMLRDDSARLDAFPQPASGNWFAGFPFGSARVLYQDGAVDYAREINMIRYSAQVLGLALLTHTGDGLGTTTYRAPVTPDGSSGTPQTRSWGATSRRLYGSWCPHTGAVSWLQEQPVCWV
tara:strand:- start:17150 stop:18787 length:1638 start_codon:yes stop_codon:yes gene_type:complete